jgi:hypothetical protein
MSLVKGKAIQYPIFPHEGFTPGKAGSPDRTPGTQQGFADVR